MHEDMAEFENHVSYTLELCMSIALCPVALYYFNLLNPTESTNSRPDQIFFGKTPQTPQ